MISIIGAGNVGATAALQVISHDLDDVTLIDIVKGKLKEKQWTFHKWLVRWGLIERLLEQKTLVN